MEDAKDKPERTEESVEELKLKLRKKLVSLMHHPAAPAEFKEKLSKSIAKLVD